MCGKTTINSNAYAINKLLNSKCKDMLIVYFIFLIIKISMNSLKLTKLCQVTYFGQCHQLRKKNRKPIRTRLSFGGKGIN